MWGGREEISTLSQGPRPRAWLKLDHAKCLTFFGSFAQPPMILNDGIIFKRGNWGSRSLSNFLTAMWSVSDMRWFALCASKTLLRGTVFLWQKGAYSGCIFWIFISTTSLVMVGKKEEMSGVERLKYCRGEAESQISQSTTVWVAHCCWVTRKQQQQQQSPWFMDKVPHGHSGCQGSLQLRPSGASISGALPGFNLLFTWSSQRMKGMVGWQIPLPSQSTATAVFFFQLMIFIALQTNSVQFSRSVMPDPATPWTAACQAFLSVTNSQSLLKLMSIKSVIPPSSHPAIPFSSCLQPCSASGFFPMSQFFTSGGQSNGASASSSVLPMNIQSWFPLGLTGLISLQSKQLSRAFSITPVQKH